MTPPLTPEQLRAALAQVAWHVERDPPQAAQLAREFLKLDPKNPRARLYLAAALRRAGDAVQAAPLLEVLAREQPNMPLVWFELGLLRATRGETQRAIEALSRTTALQPDFGEAWSALSAQHALAGNDAAAAAAAAQQLRATLKEPALAEAAKAMGENRFSVAEQLIRDHLLRQPNDVTALRMLADIGIRLGSYSDAETLLARALQIAPDFAAARYNYATALHHQHKYDLALVQIDILRKLQPQNPAYRALQAAALGQVGDYDGALAAYEDVLKAYPNQPKAWLTYGNALQAVGRQDDAIAAYRKAIDHAPTFGAAYWSLANLKTYRFTADDIAAMRAALARKDLGTDDRVHMEFALGKALEDAHDYAPSFEHYTRGNALHHQAVPYSADETHAQMLRAKSLFTKEFFAARQGQGNPSPDPIFIVGLPRAGSTLIEQILASHSAVEGTMELPDIGRIAWRLGGGNVPAGQSAYPQALANLSAADLFALGSEYLERTRVYRKLRRPFFIDKDPNNFAHAGLIHLILPNAKIVDARRHPLGCCFSAFKQHFARGQSFSYDLTDLGRYYTDYVALMAHMDEVLPGRIHRVFYERMVDDPETEIRALLAYCGLPFEETCLTFYKNDRPVRTASSEQVRQPIFRDGIAQWRNFDPWLGPLKDALGEAIPQYERAVNP